MLQVIVVALLFGFGTIVAGKKGEVFGNFVESANDVSIAVMSFIIKLSPIGVFCLITPVVAANGPQILGSLAFVLLVAYIGYIDVYKRQHLLGLINEILDVSKIESGVMELSENSLDLRALAREAAEMLRISMESRQQEFRVEIDESFNPWVMGDARRIRQVLVNILENAAKYTPQGGRITFCVCELKREEQRAGTYRFIIEDTGIGMKPEYIKHI